MARNMVMSLAMILAFSQATAQEAPNEPPLPQPRPETLDPTPTDEQATTEPAPDAVPQRVYQTACPALLSGRIIGEMQPPVAENQCGLHEPIAVSAVVVNGRAVELVGVPLTNCAMATSLADWAEAVDAHAKATLGTSIKALGTGTGYQCRLRNGEDTGFLSEHGRGNALDIASMSFENGTNISVLDDWQRLPTTEGAKFLAFAHGMACTKFTTVLGPEANQDHENHFHFDLGCHGQSCTAAICQ